MNNATLNYFSLFSGIGGFELGIKKAKPKTKCVGFSEIDDYAIKVYEAHFKHRNYGDITKISPRILPDFDLLVGGFPCQAFSLAGQRRGFKDTRGTLFFEIARIARKKQPRLLLLENVKGLLSHDTGRTFVKIITTLDELGYDLQWQVLNSKDFGVPQNRERVFIIGHLRGTSRPEVFPIGEAGSKDTARREGAIRVINQQTRSADRPSLRYSSGGSGTLCKTDEEFCLPTSGGSGRYIQQLNHPKHSNNRVYEKDGLSPTLNTMQGGGRQPYIAMTEKRTEEAKRQRRRSQNKDHSPRRAKYLDKRTDGMGNCVTAAQSREHLLTNGCAIRRLTPLECERLQGFPDGWTEGISDTQRYKTLGNAVTVNVIEAIISRL